jgi:hypothetical protein
LQREAFCWKFIHHFKNQLIALLLLHIYKNYFMIVFLLPRVVQEFQRRVAPVENSTEVLAKDRGKLTSLGRKASRRGLANYTLNYILARFDAKAWLLFKMAKPGS